MSTGSRHHDDERSIVGQPIPAQRIGIVMLLLLIGIAAVGVRTVYLQSVKTSVLSRWAENQQQNTQVLPAVRGSILDRNGADLAVGEEAVTFFVTPKLVENKAETAETIAKVLDLRQREKDRVLAALSDESTGFAYIARQVPRPVANKLIEQKIDGLHWHNEERRLYPLKEVGAQLLGFAGLDNQGIAGIELLYNRSLSGQPGKQVVVRDPAGTPLDVLSLQREVDGRDVHLTIDATIQTEAERILNETVKRYSAIGATAIVMNPRNGEILAMANVPSYDANEYARASSAWQRNRAITDTYEPGSTFKIVAISAALEDGLVSPTTSFLLPPSIKVADREIKEAEPRPTKRMTTRDILVESSNVGTITLGQMLGKHRLDHWIRHYGFGKPTDIDFPGEVPGLVLDPKDWSGSTIGNVPIGQGIGVTGIQLVSAYAAIANDGILVQPHLLKEVEGESEPEYQSRRVISAETARVMRQMFGEVVQANDGTGRLAKIPGYAVAGKTGTANKAGPGGYMKGKYHASFIGFVPAENPQLLTLVVVDEPNVPWGGQVAAPAFERITQFALQYLAIPPDGNI